MHTWITSRTVHVYGIGALLGVDGAASTAAGALDGLRGVLRDPEHGGWFGAVGPDGEPDDAKSCYAHAFVMLAGSTAVVAGLPGADDLLAEATQVFEEHFWDDDLGRVVDEWDRAWTTPAPYRGLNSTMHSLEAMLAVGDVTGDGVWHRQGGPAGRPACSSSRRRTTAGCPSTSARTGRSTSSSTATGPTTRSSPTARPSGTASSGRGCCSTSRPPWATAAPAGLLDTSRLLFDRAVADGWHADGAPGFVYTTDWEGRPVVRERMHWVVAEGIAAAAALHRRTGEEDYARRYAEWWAYARDHLIDLERGSWHHELDAANRPQASVWPGKPDLYHAVQATLLPRLPLAPSLARAVAMSGGLRAPA